MIIMEMKTCKHNNLCNIIFMCVHSCWIATDDGAIWGFAAPMIAIVIVRLFSKYVNNNNLH